jgi:hypothetical protein
MHGVEAWFPKLDLWQAGGKYAVPCTQLGAVPVPYRLRARTGKSALHHRKAVVVASVWKTEFLKSSPASTYSSKLNKKSSVLDGFFTSVFQIAPSYS